MFEGECALHVAIHRGYLPVVKAILQFNPDLEIEVCVCMCACAFVY